MTAFKVNCWAKYMLKHRGCEFKHAIRNHCWMTGQDLVGRSKAIHGDASAFCGITVGELDAIFASFLLDPLNQQIMLQWMEDRADSDDMVFLKDFGHRIGACWRYKAGCMVGCSSAIFILRKIKGKEFPVLISSYPVPDGYIVAPKEFSGRYLQKTRA